MEKDDFWFLELTITMLTILGFILLGYSANAALQIIGFFLICICLAGIMVLPIYYYLKKHPTSRAGLKKPTLEDIERSNLDALCEHLRQIGLDATVESLILRSWHTNVIIGGASARIIGAVRIANRNIDLVELRYWHTWGMQVGDSGEQPEWSGYGCVFVVQAQVEGLKDGLVAEGKPVRDYINFLDGWKVVDFQWKGNELAGILNNDADQKKYFISQRKPPKIEIVYASKQNEKLGEQPGIRIFEEARQLSPREAFPTIETFEVYDRIAQHIRSIANAQKEETH